MQKFVQERFPTRYGFLGLFVSVNASKLKLRVQLTLVMGYCQYGNRI